MNNSKAINFGVGIFMLAGIVAFLVLAFKVSGLGSIVRPKGYMITADFNNIGGLKVRSPVTVAGVKVGEVTNISLQPGILNAKVTMRLNNATKIPFEDASARILTEGLLGSNYISIVPGFEDKKGHPFLRSGDTIARTQEALVLENLIGQLLFNIKK